MSFANIMIKEGPSNWLRSTPGDRKLVAFSAFEGHRKPDAEATLGTFFVTIVFQGINQCLNKTASNAFFLYVFHV